MIKRGQIFVRAVDKNGKWDTVDVLDLDDESFRAFVMYKLYESSMVCGIKPEYVEGNEIILKEKNDEQRGGTSA